MRHATFLLTGKLNSHLAEVDTHAMQMLDSLVTQMAAREGITEQLQVTDRMVWVQRMNSIRDAAEEIVNNDMICPGNACCRGISHTMMINPL